MAKVATVHNPTNFEPADYTVEDYLDNRRPEYCGQDIETLRAEIEDWKADMERTFGADWIRKIHSCAHCGNSNIRWITAVRHNPTNEVVVFGSDCTERLGFANRVAFKLAQIQARAEARKIRFTIFNKRAEFLTANPAIADVLANINNPEHAKNFFVKDVLSKLDQYGTLSPRQVECVLASVKRDRDMVATRAAEAVEVKGDAPSGRAEVTGTVLSVKEIEGGYGWTTKMLVKLANNSKVWLTVPSGSGISRGDVVTVKATFTVSDTDKSFAFGKRPVLVNRTAAEAVACGVGQ